MSLGPIIAFDKSAFQALSDHESVWLDALYMPVITPLFFVETLADLEKDDTGGRVAENVVADLAEKTPTGARPTMHHRDLCIRELLGGRVETREVPRDGYNSHPRVGQWGSLARITRLGGSRDGAPRGQGCP